MKRGLLSLLLLIGLVSVAVSMGAGNAAGRPLCLVTNEGTELESYALQDAIAAASAGDTLVVKGICEGGGLYPSGGIEINKDLHLKGVSNPAFGVATVSPGTGQMFYISGDNTDVTIEGLTIDGGSAYGGGAILMHSGGTLTLERSVVTGANAGDGGAIYNQYSTVILNDSSITNNHATGSGGISNYGGTVILNDSSITGNSAKYSGAGIGNYSGTVTLNHSVISGNAAHNTEGQPTRGGGVYTSQGGTITLNDSQITGNSATIGGGIFNNSAWGATTLVNCIDGVNVVDNTPDNIVTGTP